MPKVGMEPLRRRQLIEATIATIHQDGFQDTTVAGISRRAGLSVGLVNHYFEGKGELLEATMETLSERTLEDVRDGIERGTTPREKLMGFIEGQFAPNQRSPEAISAWLSFYAQVPENPGFARIEYRFDEELLALLRPLLVPLVPAKRLETLAQTLVALVYGLWLRHAHNPERFDLDLIHSIARDYVADMLGDADG
jgi:TetR/AcrR family transcriptional repressor of bet genes